MTLALQSTRGSPFHYRMVAYLLASCEDIGLLRMAFRTGSTYLWRVRGPSQHHRDWRRFCSNRPTHHLQESALIAPKYRAQMVRRTETVRSARRTTAICQFRQPTANRDYEIWPKRTRLRTEPGISARTQVSQAALFHRHPCPPRTQRLSRHAKATGLR